MAKHVKRSVLPIYLVGVTWLAYAALLPLRTPVQYALCAALSAVVFVAGKAIFPDKVYQIPGEAPEREEKKRQDPPRQEQPKRPASTGDPQIDALAAQKASEDLVSNTENNDEIIEKPDEIAKEIQNLQASLREKLIKGNDSKSDKSDEESNDEYKDIG